MKCAVCQRELAPNLSMCVRCGAMRNDSVREEIESTITPLATPVRFHFVEDRADPVPIPATAASAAVLKHPVSETKPADVPEVKPAVRRSHTADLGVKKTSPTLAEFKNPNQSMPDWRLQLQNSVRQRAGRAETQTATVGATPGTRHAGRTAAALKVQYAEEPVPENLAEQKVANALKRIEQSRRTYLPTEKAREGIRVAKAASRNFPFNVVSRSADLPERPATTPKEPATTARPRLISSMKIEKKAYDTNKLVPIPEAAYLASSFENADKTDEPQTELKENWSQKIEISESESEIKASVPEPTAVEETEPETDEIDDLAPISMRFNAGLFDLIIGGFASFILISPFLAWSENWVSFSGLLTFASVLMAVMFVYLTASVAFLGQTFGMKLFGLELIDIDQSEFPTLHQAAVNSSVYLLSLVSCGLGFLPILFNEERRAAHDLVSGTILVRGI